MSSNANPKPSSDDKNTNSANTQIHKPPSLSLPVPLTFQKLSVPYPQPLNPQLQTAIPIRGPLPRSAPVTFNQKDFNAVLLSKSIQDQQAKLISKRAAAAAEASSASSTSPTTATSASSNEDQNETPAHYERPDPPNTLPQFKKIKRQRAPPPPLNLARSSAPMMYKGQVMNLVYNNSNNSTGNIAVNGNLGMRNRHVQPYQQIGKFPNQGQNFNIKTHVVVEDKGELKIRSPKAPQSAPVAIPKGNIDTNQYLFQQQKIRNLTSPQLANSPTALSAQKNIVDVFLQNDDCKSPRPKNLSSSTTSVIDVFNDNTTRKIPLSALSEKYPLSPPCQQVYTDLSTDDIGSDGESDTDKDENGIDEDEDPETKAIEDGAMAQQQPEKLKNVVQSVIRLGSDIYYHDLNVSDDSQKDKIKFLELCSLAWDNMRA